VQQHAFSPSHLQAEKGEFGPPRAGDFKENPVFVDHYDHPIEFTTETQEQNSTNNKSPPTFKKKKKKPKVVEEQTSMAQQYIVTATFGGEQKFLPVNDSKEGTIQI